ncbi:MAG: response regulator [Candidatus Bathyarchaeota archaeon]|nr:response regulator [Candidatus Bathyarchaeota archaeon]
MTLNPEDNRSNQINVLHIDDEKQTLYFTREILNEINPWIKIKSASNPKKALSSLGDYDCIVTDYKMPEVDGITLIEEIRAVSDVPIILYTGQGSEEVAERAFTAGVNHYIRKEMDSAHYKLLEQSIKTVVEKHRVERQLRNSERELSRMVQNSPDAIYRIELPRSHSV